MQREEMEIAGLAVVAMDTTREAWRALADYRAMETQLGTSYGLLRFIAKVEEAKRKVRRFEKALARA